MGYKKETKEIKQQKKEMCLRKYEIEKKKMKRKEDERNLIN